MTCVLLQVKSAESHFLLQRIAQLHVLFGRDVLRQQILYDLFLACKDIIFFEWYRFTCCENFLGYFFKAKSYFDALLNNY